MKNLKDYEKVKPETTPKKTTSVFIEKRQVEFLRRRNLNLSKLIRDFLDSLMKGEKEKK